MKKVDFFIPKFGDPKTEEILACQIFEIAFKKLFNISIVFDNEFDLNHYNELLWTFKNTSFVPHSIGTDHSIHSDFGKIETDQVKQIMINKSKKIPQRKDDMLLIIESAGTNDEARHLAREKFKLYKDENFSISTHDFEHLSFC